jgi:hypothetical protein
MRSSRHRITVTLFVPVARYHHAVDLSAHTDAPKAPKSTGSLPVVFDPHSSTSTVLFDVAFALTVERLATIRIDIDSTRGHRHADVPDVDA